MFLCWCWWCCRSKEAFWLVRELPIYFCVQGSCLQGSLIRGKIFDLHRLLVKYLRKAADVAEIIFHLFSPVFLPCFICFTWCIKLKFNKLLMAVYWGVQKTCSRLKLVPHPVQSTCTHPSILLPYFWKPQITPSPQQGVVRLPKICCSAASPYFSMGSDVILASTASRWYGFVRICLVLLIFPVVQLSDSQKASNQAPQSKKKTSRDVGQSWWPSTTSREGTWLLLSRFRWGNFEDKNLNPGVISSVLRGWRDWKLHFGSFSPWTWCVLHHRQHHSESNHRPVSLENHSKGP